ncbi:MAG: GNAT family N-acetyltransferase [Azonexus sp.]
MLLNSRNSLILNTPEIFVGEVRAILAKYQNAQQNTDPHLVLEWFLLLAETAMPHGVLLALYPLSQGRAQEESSYLPVMVLPNEHRKILALGNFYTPLFGLVNEAQTDEDALTQLAKLLRNSSPAFNEAQFSPLDTESRSFSLLETSFKNAGWLVDDYVCFGNWHQKTNPGNFAAYLSERPSRLQNTLLRAEKKFSKTGGYKLQIIQENNALLGASIDAYVQVYNQSWKNPEPFPEFIPGLCQLAARNGWLRLGLIFLDNVPIAAQLWLVVEKKAFIVKLAYDQKFIKTSAGTVLTGALFRHVIDVDRVEEVDYLMGDDQYKQDWMSQRRERRGIIAFNPRTPLGIAKAVYHFGGKIMRMYSPFIK